MQKSQFLRPETLLQRIAKAGRRDSKDHDGAEAIRSVIDHLRNMLNTRQGDADIAPDYGMPDFTAFVQLPDVRGVVQTAILDSIRKYELRLRNVRVQYIDTDGLEIRFAIVAALPSEAGLLPVRFETMLESSGRIRIAG